MAYDGSIKIDTKIDNSGFSDGINKMKSVAARGSAAISASLAVVSAGMIAGGKAAIDVGSSFESAMDKVSAISGATGDDLAKLSSKAKEMGANTKFSASESAEALQYMAMAGWETGDMLEGISGIMSLAAADGLDLATTSDIVTDAITAFGLKASDSSHFADVLAKASSSANTNVSMLGESFKYVAPLAGTMGYSVEDVSVALGLMANASVKGSMAGTSLKTALANLSSPTKAMKAVMDEYKISMTDVHGNSLALIDVIKELREKFGGLSETEQTAAASTLFGKEAMSGMLAIINASDSDFTKLIDNISNADGAASSMAETMQDNLQGQITILKSSLEGLGIEIYKGMQEPLKDAAIEAQGYVKRLTNAFSDGGLSGMIEEAGNIFGELAVKAAEYAPKMVEAAVGFIESFVRGIAANSDKLIEAAKDIVWTIVNGLIKLLPAEVQKPVLDTVNSIKKSFESGGLRTAINTVKNIIVNLGKVISNVAKVVLPVMSKALDLLTGKSKLLIVAASALFAAYKGYKIFTAAAAALSLHTAAVTAESLAEAASTGAITLKQIAVGLLTGEIGLATAAQYAWNLAMSMNPIGIVIAAVAALTAGVAAFAMTSGDAEDRTKRLKEAQEDLAEANTELGNTYESIGSKFSDFMSEIEGAGSILDGFNENILISDEDKQALENNMESVQSEITEICAQAAEERRDLTGGEIQRLEELFRKLHELSEQELAIEQAKQNVVVTAAKDLAGAADVSLGEYTERSQKIANTAEETRSAVITKAEEQYYEELALLQQRFDTDTEYTEAQFEADRQAAKKSYDTAIDEANKVAGDTLDIIVNGYADKADAISEGTRRLNTLNKAEESENDTYAKNMKAIYEWYVAEKKKIMDKGYSEQTQTYELSKIGTVRYHKEQDEEERHSIKLGEIRNSQNKVLNDDRYQDQLRAFLGLVGLYETYTGKTHEKSENIVKAFHEPMENMDEDTYKAFANAIQGGIEGLESKVSSLYWKAKDIVNSVINIFTSGFDEHSPSKVFKKIFGFALEGGEIGLDAETPKLYKKADTIGKSFTQRLAEGINANITQRLTEGIDSIRLLNRLMTEVTANTLTATNTINIALNQCLAKGADAVALLYQLKDGVSAGRGIISDMLTAKVVHDVDVSTDDYNRRFVIKGDIHSHMEVDGREFAVATAPYVSEELAWGGDFA